MERTAYNSTCPVSRLNRVRRSSSPLKTFREAARYASSIAPMTMPGSMPLSLATTSIICWSSVAAINNLCFFLKLDFQPGASDRCDRHAMGAAALFEQHHAFFHAGQPAFEVRLTVYRLRRHDLRQAAGEPPVVALVPQRPIEPRRRHLEGVFPIDAAQ